MIENKLGEEEAGQKDLKRARNIYEKIQVPLPEPIARVL
jgi:hypothetical protein